MKLGKDVQMEDGTVFHAALSFRNVGADLGDKKLLQKVAERIVEHFRLDVVDVHWHYYSPIGITGVYVLQQSSLTLHTWPEFNKLVIDVTTCGSEVDLKIILPELKAALSTDTVQLSAEIL
ncbi:S-adenosylmethionine decarboxylase family protein [Candidatus Electrothrix sp.]|uniref:S-adenosylmethionine decarboxylase family protein n=2 Tax=Candidatus Electrothrix sp. TaxID=2170559 RepID=UPI004057C188